uniref:Peptidase_S9 domain-containing protein n=1 Tax=Parastrongyloides trichosuri TaxID=131310 RepID=A0A0N4Z1N8_PARTI
MDRKNCRHKHVFITRNKVSGDQIRILKLASLHTELVKQSRNVTERKDLLLKNQSINVVKDECDKTQLSVTIYENNNLEPVLLIPVTCMEILKNEDGVHEEDLNPHIRAITKFGLKTKNTIDKQKVAMKVKKVTEPRIYKVKGLGKVEDNKANKMRDAIDKRISIKKTRKSKLYENRHYNSLVPLTTEQCVFLETLDLLRNQAYIVNCQCAPEELPSTCVSLKENFLKSFYIFKTFVNILLCPPLCKSISRKGAFWNPKPQYWFFYESNNSKSETKVIRKGSKKYIKNIKYQFMFEHPCIDFRKKCEYFFIECKETKHVIACAFVKSLSSNYTIIYSHQNACDLGDNIVGYPNICDISLFLNCDVLCYDYSGYGISGGKPSEKALKDNILSLIDHVHYSMNVPLNKIILLGFSLGGAVSTIGATARNVGGLITLAAPASISQVIKSLLHCGVGGRELEEYESEYSSSASFNTSQNIKNVTCPYLGIHAHADRLVPISHAKAIFNNCRTTKYNLYVNDSNHNYLDTASEVWIRINEFLYNDLIYPSKSP